MYYFARLNDDGVLGAVAEWVEPVPPEWVRGKENGLYYATPALWNAVGERGLDIPWKFLDENQTLIGLESETME